MPDVKNEINPTVMIEGKGLCKIFKDFWGRKKVEALSEVNLSVKEGVIFGLLGPNGAGKSTLIKLILGHLYPTKGRLSVLGKNPRDVTAKERIGYLPETSSLYKNLNALETLKFFGAILNLSNEQIKRRSQQLLEMVGLETAKKRMVGEYSHGMKRRLGMAQALLNDPSLLILDEPTAGLDPLGCREVKDIIITLGKRGKTVLLTSHLLADVEDVCDEILLLFGGKTQARGNVSQLLKDRTMTQLQFPSVSKQTMEEVKAVLRKELNENQIVSTSPLESLESFFLRVVAKSTTQMQETYGAQMGKGVAEYLRDQNYQPREFAAELVQGKDKNIEATSLDKTTLDTLSNPKASEIQKSVQRTDENLDTTSLKKLTKDHPSDSALNKQKSKKDEGVDKHFLDDLTSTDK